MNTFNRTQKTLIFTLAFLAVGFLTSCSTKKSDELASPAAVNISSQKAMASCNRLTDSNFSFSLAVVSDGSGQVNYDWLKVKFRYLSSNITQSGYTLRFYKWRMNGSVAQLDSTPLPFAAYNTSTGQTSSNQMTAIFATQVSSQNGFYVQLNDDAQNPYQALKVVAYKSDGTVLAQADALIPQFAASPLDYKFNTDGSIRASNLQQMHPLATTDVSQWSAAQIEQHFSQYCF